MTKYYKVGEEFPENSSHYKLLQYINNGDTVLEFGCASGYMSKYMHQKLSCKVYGIDICQEALNEAIPFLEKGICADIESLDWQKEILGGGFDVIMFADVLEHLKNPEEVLKAAVGFLKPDGKVLVSVPNIANGDIVCKLLKNRFDYTTYGLLDNTHVHFWGSDNLYDLCENCGLSLVELNGTTCPIQYSEQRLNETPSYDMLNIISQNQYSTVFQFVFMAYKREFAEKLKVKPSRPIDEFAADTSSCVNGKIYFNINGFSEDNSVPFTIKNQEIKTGKISISEKCGSIRFDPIEGYCCAISNLAIGSSNGILQVCNGNYDKNISENYFFSTSDPQLFITIPSGTAWVEISCAIVVLDSIYEQKIMSDLILSYDLSLNEKNDLTKMYEANINTIKNRFETENQKYQQEKYALVQRHETEIAEIKNEFEKERQQHLQEKCALTQQYEAEIAILKGEFESKRQQWQEENSALVQKHENDIWAIKDDFEAEKGKIIEEHSCETAQLTLKIKELSRECAQSNISNAEMHHNLEETQFNLNSIREQLSQRDQLIADIQDSFSWKITRPLFNFKRAIGLLMNKYAFTSKIRKALSIWRHHGFKEMVNAYKRHRNKQKETAAFEASINSNMQPDNKTGYSPYDSEYQPDMDFSSKGEPAAKLLAFYLPQYHTFPENDEWWGKGFTEWTNVRTGKPQFEGHYQPRVPHADIGYYSLEDVETLKFQAELAKKHGVYGFCFYYYWFSGKRLMEKPLDMLIEHSEIDLPFCLCWANENWTRAWDGLDRQILIKQDYSEEDDDNFIADMKKYISDPRYIRIGGKPLIVVYNPGHIPNPHKSFRKWRQCAAQIGVGEILIWTCQTANNTAKILNIEDCIDAEVEFPPHNIWVDSIAVRNMDVGGKSAYIYNFQCLVKYMEAKLEEEDGSSVPVHHSFMMAWDNEARRKNGWFTFYAFSLHSLYRWILAILKRTKKDFAPEDRFIFVNAWNEWGEGTYLEPDEKYGYANINTVSKALYGLPFYDDLKVLDESCPISKSSDEAMVKSTKIAVQVHIFYLDIMDEIILELNKIPYPFDCYISTDSENKKEKIFKKLRESCDCRKIEVKVFQNRGRDVAPFIVQLREVISQYEFICHIHSKKTCTGDYGDDWRRYNFRHLFGNTEYIKRIFNLFEENKSLGLVFPETYPVLELQAEWGGNRDGVAELLKKMNCNITLPEKAIFPVGNMFWARSEAVRKIFDLNLTHEDFPEEAGQVNATIAHQIERVWVYAAEELGYQYCKTFNNFDRDTNLLEKKRLGIFVHYDRDDIISEDDNATIQTYSELLSALIFVTNSDLNAKEINKIKPMTTHIIKRNNIGFDFGGWRDALLELGKDKISEYDELVLINNSCFKPVFDLKNMFYEMEQKNVDFWGNTIFPYSSDGSYINKSCIPEHLQSYFLVFGRNVLQSKVFWDFWKEVPDYNSLIEVIANCESQLTKLLSDAGFSYEPYIRETYYISRYLMNYAIPYEKPSAMLLLGNPFVKKKCYQNMDDEERNKFEWIVKKLVADWKTSGGISKYE